MDLLRLKTLVTLADNGSMAAAARALEVSTATVRKRIGQLEAEVGVALVARSGRSLRLTPSGEVLVRGAVELIERSRSLVDRVCTNATGVLGEYRVAVPLGVPPQLSAHLVATHHAHFPGLRLRVLPVARPLQLLPHQADVAVTFEPRPSEGPWLSAVLRRVPEVVMATRAYLDRHGVPDSAEELHEHALLSWQPPGEDGQRWPLRSGDSIAVRPTLISPDILLVRRCAIAGQGLARVPDGGMADFGVPPGTLEPVRPDLFGRELALRVVIPDTPKMRSPYRQFIESVRTVERTV